MDKLLGYPAELPLCLPDVEKKLGMEESCCICGDAVAVEDNLLVYCDGLRCNIGVHQACYGIEKIPSGPWLCQKCEAGDSYDGQPCCLCISSDGALKKTDTGKWAHVLCALYIPGCHFAEEKMRMEPIYVSEIPHGRFNNTCYICEQGSRSSDEARSGACMSCRRPECPRSFHVTCAQKLGLLIKKTEPGKSTYLGYCQDHIMDVKESKILKKLRPFSRATRTTVCDGLRALNETDGSSLVCVNDSGPGAAPMMALEVEVTSEANGGGGDASSSITMDRRSPNNSVENKMEHVPKVSNEERARKTKCSIARLSINRAKRIKRGGDSATKREIHFKQWKPLQVKGGNAQLRPNLRRKARHPTETARSPVTFPSTQDGEWGPMNFAVITQSTEASSADLTTDIKAPASAASVINLTSDSDSDINTSKFTTPNFHSMAEVNRNYEVEVTPEETYDSSCFTDNIFTGGSGGPSGINPVLVTNCPSNLEHVLDKTLDPTSLGLDDMSQGLSIPDLLSYLFHLKAENRSLESRISHLTERRENLKEIIAISSVPMEFASSSDGNMA